MAAYLVPFLAALSSACFALDAQSRSIALSGEAQSVCSFSPAQALEAANMALSPSPALQNAVSVAVLIDPSTAKQQAASISLSLKGLCNRAHSISIGTGQGGLTPQSTLAAVPNGFSSRVDYTARVLWASSATALRTAGISGQTTPLAMINGAYSGTLRLEIMIEPGGAAHRPVVAGSYTDNLVITIQPQY